MLARLAPVLALIPLLACTAPTPADTVLINGKIFTANPSQPWAQAVAITGDRITAVGESSAIGALAGERTRRIDLGGRTVIPGINDAHQHVAIAPPTVRLELPFDPTLEQIAAAIAAQVKTSAPGRLIAGDFSQTAWGNPAFTRAWLDKLAPDHPVRLSAFTGHGRLLNSRALALAGIEDSVRDPEGGRYGRDAADRLDGRLEEYADYMSSRRFIAKMEPPEITGAYRKFAAEASGFGITSVQLMADPMPIAQVSKYLAEADLPLRWRGFRFPMREAGGETIDSRPVLPPQPTPRIDMRGMKWIIDGTPVERLAFLRAPYQDAPGQRGRLNFPPERIAEFVGWAYGSEDPLAVHAVGDAAIEAYVAAVEAAGRAEVWRAKRPRIEHGDMMPPDLIARVKAMGMVVVQNPMHFMLGEILAARLGAERVASIQPMKSLLEAGVPLAIGSDGPMNPFLNIMAAVTHPANPKEALTREQAVTAYTAGSAFAEFKEQEKGQLAVGMLADLAVLSGDVFTVPVDQMEAIRSVLTMFGGRIVHETGAVR